MKWRTKLLDCNPQVWVDWVNSGTQNEITTTLSKVCSLTIEVTVTFLRYPMGGYYESVKTIDITVAPPNSLVLSDPTILGVDQDPVALGADGNLAVSFNIMFNGRQANVQGPVQEFITHLPPVEGPPGASAGPLPKFSASLGRINDWKGVGVGPPLTGPAGIDFFAEGHLFDNLNQSMRISLPNGCGGNDWFVLTPVFHFQLVKSATPGKWKLLRVQ